MGDYTTAAAAQGGASLVSSFVNNLFSSHQNRDSARRAAYLAQQQRNYELAMFNLENRYNSPSNQARLLQEAGLNPASMSFGFNPASAGAGVAGENPSSVPYHVEAPDVASLFTARKQEKMQDEQIEAMRLKNEGDRLDLEAKKELLPIPNPFSPDDYDSSLDDVDFGDFNNIVEVTTPAPLYNYYQEQRGKSRIEFEHAAIASEKALQDLKILWHTAPSLMKMPAQQLASLIEDIKGKELQNGMLKLDSDFKHKYGIDGKESNWVSALFKAMLYSPESVNRIVDALRSAGEKTMEHLVNSISAESIVKGSPLYWIMRRIMKESE